MSYVCENCRKKTVAGHSRRHRRGIAGKRWLKRAQVTPRTFKPNLQKIAVMVDGIKKTLKLCTRCLKRFEKDGKLFDYRKSALG